MGWLGCCFKMCSPRSYFVCTLCLHSYRCNSNPWWGSSAREQEGSSNNCRYSTIYSDEVDTIMKTDWNEWLLFLPGLNQLYKSISKKRKHIHIIYYPPTYLAMTMTIMQSQQPRENERERARKNLLFHLLRKNLPNTLPFSTMPLL